MMFMLMIVVMVLLCIPDFSVVGVVAVVFVLFKSNPQTV